MTNFMANFGNGADKFMNRMFRRAEGVVWDLTTGKVGIQTENGIASLEGEGDEARVVQNMFDQFGMEVPAFAQNTPVAQVNLGDLVYFGTKGNPGWVIEKQIGVKPVGSTSPRKKPVAATATDPAPVPATSANTRFTLMRVDGTRTTWTPPKVQMLGMGDNGVMVLRSLLNMLPGGESGLVGMQNMMMPLMFMGENSGFDLEKMMPMILMQAMTPGGQGGNMMQMMMFAAMMNKDGGFFGKKSSNSNGGPFNR